MCQKKSGIGIALILLFLIIIAVSNKYNMKNLQAFFIISLFTLFTMSSCKEYTSLTNATKVSQLNGNPFIYNLSKSILRNTGKFLIEKGMKGIGTKLNLTTPLSAIISDPSHIGDFTNMLSSTYKIPSGALAKKYSSLSSVKDLIYFVANHGQKFNFYSN